MAHLQENKIERVRDASGSDGDRIGVADCDPFPVKDGRWRRIQHNTSAFYYLNTIS